MKRIIALLAAAAACIAGGGWLIGRTWHLGYAHGLYCAMGTATTLGCDASPPSSAGRWAQIALMVTAIPLLGAAFALMTGRGAAVVWHALHSAALDARLEEMREHLSREMRTHRQQLEERLNRHHAELVRRHDQALDLLDVQQRAIVQQAERHHEALLGAVAAAAPVPLEPLISAEAPAVPVPGPAAERLTGRAVRPKGAPKGRAS